MSVSAVMTALTLVGLCFFFVNKRSYNNVLYNILNSIGQRSRHKSPISVLSDADIDFVVDTLCVL